MTALPRHLKRLENESIHIMREVAAEFRNPVFLYSIGKDSSVMLHLALKAFHPAPPPFPFLHIASTWDFRDMIAHRDRMAAEHGLRLIVHTNEEALARGVSPLVSDVGVYTRTMLTEALKQALDAHGFDAAFGGGRRDEEKARAKERIFSFRSASHGWDPKNQRPELWNTYNTRVAKGETIRVFPLSNWTEADIWQYIYLEGVPIVPLYLARPRPVVTREGAMIVVDDERLPLAPGETPTNRMVRFRTLGCYPLSAAVESDAATLEDVVLEALAATSSERQGRLIDRDEAASMEAKKREGYF
ncbi:sulfate adenylyltransferase subunit CysD [Alsobacter sp. SYSU M60028]|uniref:Sulfate adenylyltransferase subunit 2 n=1 Tax=Alsobacter ponti TaxID=2962936 RepID=A0ABT1LE37_9HYPH|nr:sulfate adenylyltransferase subunit CysD [Alsobacter ponti]MCP8939767.1 sulfate adenylyltransferase subunit CysD [Alsobacter ponti]